ncbi:MAG: hypothetical protein GX587_03190 [Bacteroidales bacterium]|nr:hypothetical protein [Bacteroidales bacterium]
MCQRVVSSINGFYGLLNQDNFSYKAIVNELIGMTEKVSRYIGKLNEGAGPFFFEQNKRLGITFTNRNIMKHWALEHPIIRGSYKSVNK